MEIDCGKVWYKARSQMYSELARKKKFGDSGAPSVIPIVRICTRTPISLVATTTKQQVS